MDKIIVEKFSEIKEDKKVFFLACGIVVAFIIGLFIGCCAAAATKYLVNPEYCAIQALIPVK